MTQKKSEIFEYSFQSNYFNYKGNLIHYIDEGEGEILLFHHGTPSWSYEFRNIIAKLSNKYRCIAFDMLGFGLSDKPMIDYNLELHNDVFEKFIKYLKIDKFSIIAHDFGGPISLTYCVENVQKINKIFLLNTWAFPLTFLKNSTFISKFLSSRITDFLYLNLNFPIRILMPKAFKNWKNMDSKIKNNYAFPFDKKENRYGTLGFAKSLFGAENFYNRLYSNLHKLDDKNLYIIWGENDTLLDIEIFEKLKEAFKNSTSNRIEAGHFLAEEQAELVSILIDEKFDIK